MTGWSRLHAIAGLFATACLLAAPAAAHETTTIHIGDGWARAPLGAAKTGAAFLTLYNTGDRDDRLVAVSSPAAKTVELHRTEMVDGVMKMRPVEGIPVTAAGHTALRPGGLHIMLMGAADLQPDDTLSLTLEFSEAGAQTVELPVLKAGTTPEAVRQQTLVPIHRITKDGAAEPVGTLALRQHADGLLAVPMLQGLEPGPHAMHVHENGTCGPAEKNGEMTPGAAAGGHYDPADADSYDGPYANGARGDMPNLFVEHGGTATIPVLAPRLSLAEVRGRSVMIHQGADRYGPHLPGAMTLTGDHGGHGDEMAQGHSHGGMRMFCGVIPE